MLKYARHAIALAIVLGAWQSVYWFSSIPAQYFPSVPTAVQAFFRLFVTADVLTNEFISLRRAFLGLAGAVTLGLTLALLAAAYDVVRRALEPFAELMRPIPAAAIVPISVFAIGFNYKLFLFLTVFVGVWPTYINALAGLRGAGEVLINTGRSFGCSRWELLWNVRLPNALPEIFVGIRLSSSIALVSTTVAEMLLGRDGIGSLLFLKAFAIQVADVFALTLLTGLNGILMMQCTFWLRDFLGGWHKRMVAEAA